MKTKDVDALVSMVRELARALEDPWAIGRLHWVMLSLIELAREGKAYKALDVAFETNAYLCIMAEKAQKDLKAAQAGTSIGIGTVAPTSVTGYVQVRPEAPKPVATVEQMRAAADAAMAHDEEMDEYTCDSCHKITLVPMDSGTPKGWQPSDNPDGEEYICNECQVFGRKHEAHIGWFVCNGCGQRTATADGKKPLGWVFNDQIDGKVYKALCPPCFGTGIPQKCVCGWCNSTTESRVFPPRGWKESDDNEVICFACAEEEAKA